MWGGKGHAGALWGIENRGEDGHTGVTVQKDHHANKKRIRKRRRHSGPGVWDNKAQKG